MAGISHQTLTRTLLLVCLAFGLVAAAPGTGTLIVEVGNVRNGAGRIHVDVCTQDQFLKEDCLAAAEAQAHAGTTRVTVHGLPTGRFAVQATHDENDNHKVDRALFGIPKEGIGFSRDARIGLGPPKWEDAVIAFDGHSATTTLHLRYFLGPSGPAPR